MKTISALILACTCGMVPSIAGTTFLFETRGLDPSQPAVEQVRISAEGLFLKMDIEIGEDGHPANTVIYDDRNGKMTIVDHEARNYMVLDRETLESFGTQISSAMSEMQKQMEAAMANMPPEQRKMMEQMMKDRMPATAPATAPPRAKSELRKTSRRETVGDYTCIVYDVLRDGEKIREHCVSPWNEVGLPSETVDLLKHMGEFFEETFGAFAKNMPGGQAPPVDNPFAELQEMDAFPVMTREFEGGKAASENILREVSRVKLEAGAFEPPSGYAERKMEMPRMR